MKRRNFLIVNLINRKALLVAGLIALVFCLTFTMCDLFPEDNDVTDITLSATTLSIAEGDLDYLYITGVQPAGATYTRVSWKTSEPTYATVKDGIITTLVSSGNRQVTITAETGKASKSCTVNITAAPTGTKVSSVSLNKTSILLYEGRSEKISETVNPSNASNKGVFWISSDPEVAKVTQNGTITAVSEGTASITVYTKNGKQSKSCVVEVEAAPQENISVSEISFENSTLALKVGDIENLIVTVLPEDAANKEVTWSSNNTGVVTVTDGTVTAVSAGEATITVTSKADSTKTATCTVKVSATGSSVTGITLNSTALSMPKGGKFPLIAKVVPNDATNKDVTWSSSSAGVATVDDDGIVTAVNTGNAIITVKSSENNTITATCSVEVYEKSQSTYFGTYSGEYTSTKKITETIVIAADMIRISDDASGTGPTQDFLEFTVTKWEPATTPSAQNSDYPIAFKITGKITGAKPEDTAKLYGGATAPGFTSKDKGVTECWMYIYISSDGKKLIRSPFSKGEDNLTDPIPYSSTNKTLRSYSKTTS